MSNQPLIDILLDGTEEDILTKMIDERMTGIKGKSGGAREGAGRKLMYGEPVKRIMFQVPESKAEEVKKKVQAMLKRWEVKKPK